MTSALRRLSERAFAIYYPPLLERAERAGLRELRAALIGSARGRTLELGAGTGVNVPHYPPSVTGLVLSDPSPDMLRRLRGSLDRGAEVLEAPAEATGLPSAGFDTVVATFMLCTVDDPDLVLREVHRLLVPGGRFLFLEHVRAAEGTRLGALQDLIETPHTWLAAGCHPNRRTAELLERSPLEVVALEHGQQPRAVPTVRPIIYGEARKP